MKNRSSIALKKFIDGAKNHFLALEKLDEPLWDIMILIILIRKLDSIMLGNWRKQALALAHNPTFKDFHEFLETQVICLESFSADSQQQHLTHNQRQHPTNSSMYQSERRCT